MTGADAADRVKTDRRDAEKLALSYRSGDLTDVATILKKEMGTAARRVPTRELPDWVVRFFALFISDMKMIVPELGNRKNVSNEKAKRVLGWVPRSSEEAIPATGESLAQLGLMKK